MPRSNVLVDADWVEAHLDDPKVVLVEVDEDTTAYDKGHIRGAIKLDWTTDLQDQVRRDFVNKAQFEALLSAKGIANDDTVVLYGGNNNWFAAYAYWYFKLYGHEDVKLLDGGRKKWELDSPRAGRRACPRAADDVVHRARSRTRSIRAFRDEVVAAIGTKNLVDVRSPDEFAGRLLAPAHLPQEQAQRAGPHPDRAQHPVEQGGQRRRHLQVRRRAQGSSTPTRASTSAKDTIAYCRIGERSAHTWFVLHELLGQPNVKNYDGSWTEYGSLVGVPVALGDEPGRRSLMCGATTGGLVARRRRRRQGGRDPGQSSRVTASRSAAPTCGCSTAPVSSPPRCRRRRPAQFRFFAGAGRVDAARAGRRRAGGREGGRVAGRRHRGADHAVAEAIAC